MATVSSHLHAPATFYWAITKPPEVRTVYHDYKIGGHPRTHSDLPGDFAYNGALYVMAVGS
jgi:hypothetical protein